MFNNILDFIKNFSTLQKVITGLVLLVVLYYLYNWYNLRKSSITDQTENYNNVNNGGNGGELVCTMYYTTWCGYCKKAKPHWEQIENELNGKVINGKKIVILKVDCEKNPEIAEKEEIKGYPTFKFVMNGENYEYPDEPEFQKFKTFIEYLAGL